MIKKKNRQLIGDMHEVVGSCMQHEKVVTIKLMVKRRGWVEKSRKDKRNPMLFGDLSLFFPKFYYKNIINDLLWRLHHHSFRLLGDSKLLISYIKLLRDSRNVFTSFFLP